MTSPAFASLSGVLRGLLGPATVGGLLAAAAVARLAVGGGERARAWTLRLAWLGFATFAVWQAAVLTVLPDGNTDLKAFLLAGRESAAGRDPYLSGGDMVALNPPPAQGLFRLAAVLPYPAAAAAWSLLNAAMVLALVPLSNRLLARDREDDPDASPALPPDLAALLAAVMLNSNAALRGHRWGQLCALTAFAVMMALRARQLGRPARAGAWLAVAAFKPATALPFLVLFLRRADRRAWAACAAVSLGLTAVAAPPSAWASLFRNNLRQIAEAGEPGKINDYGFGRDISADMVALNQLFHRVGLRDRALISALQSAGAAGVLALALAVRNRRPFAAAASLAACGSMLFLYHRAYDAVVLALPAAYAASLAVHSTGRRRGVAVASVGLLLSVVCQPREALIGLTSWSLDRGAIGRVMQALVLPYATWALLLATAGLAVLTFAPAPAPVTPPSPAPTRRAGRPDPVMSARS